MTVTIQSALRNALKWSKLPWLNEQPAEDDFLAIVDKSESDPTKKNKNVTIQNLLSSATDCDRHVSGDQNKVFTSTEQSKLANIEDGANANVQSDWDAESGDARILNKPTFATVATSGNSDNLEQGSINLLMTTTERAKLDGVESGATADQTASEIVAAFDSERPLVSQGDAEAGTATGKYQWSPLRVAQSIAALTGTPTKANYTATTDPGASNDISEGYAVGSSWINTSTDESFRCVDNSADAAVWLNTSLTADDLAAVAVSGNSDDLSEGSTKLLMTTSERSKLYNIEAEADKTDAGNVSAAGAIMTVASDSLASDHTADGRKISLTANTSFVFGEVGYIGADGEVRRSDADAESTGIVHVMAAESISASATGLFILPGSVVRDDSWSWTSGNMVYLSVTAGALSATGPSSAGKVNVCVGFAISATHIFFNPSLTAITFA